MFSVKEHGAHTFGFACHGVCEAATYCKPEGGSVSAHTNGPGHVPIKLYLKQQAVGWVRSSD